MNASEVSLTRVTTSFVTLGMMRLEHLRKNLCEEGVWILNSPKDVRCLVLTDRDRFNAAAVIPAKIRRVVYHANAITTGMSLFFATGKLKRKIVRPVM